MVTKVTVRNMKIALAVTGKRSKKRALLKSNQKSAFRIQQDIGMQKSRHIGLGDKGCYCSDGVSWAVVSRLRSS